jgi:hypothetical protein
VNTVPQPATSRHATRLLCAVLAATLALLAAVGIATAEPAHAANPGVFQAGYIISDAAFYDSGSMSAAQIQSFLDGRGAGCRPGADGTPCLKDFRQNTVTRAADTRCTGTYDGAAGETAARILAKVAAACRISPQVLLVMLQKEQGLVTAGGSALHANRYRSAMGFACPDTAPCDARYHGFFNQVYQAAWQLRSYALTPTRWAHRAGAVNDVRYHPNAVCGTSPVYIHNQATASLYNYTPYQPNTAALAAGLGAGDACSSYGNRNFFTYYRDWFGTPNGLSPIGSVDSVGVTSTGLTISGWVLDPDTSDPTEAHVYIDGVGYPIRADLSRPDVATAYGRGDRHGFSRTIAAAPGAHGVCTFAISAGPGDNSLIDCRTVTVPDAAPIGAVDTVAVSGGTLTVAGWALDPDTTASTQVHVYVGTVGTALPADGVRTDVAAAHGRGDRHGFSWSTPLPPGTHRVCTFAINTVAGPNTLLDCRDVTVAGANRPPVGVVDSMTVAGSELTVSGWALDPDTAGPIPVHVYVGTQGAALIADRSRPDVAAAFGNGDRHGYSHTRTLGPGRHTVCVFGIDASAADRNSLLGCRDVTVVPDRAPIGVVDSVTVSRRQVTVSGWTLDPDTSTPISVHVDVDGARATQLADLPRPDLQAVYRLGDRHGFSHTRALTPGVHEVCAVGASSTPPASTSLGCRTVTIT